jgi:formylglycine-generating enzyme required for sulfatase activity
LITINGTNFMSGCTVLVGGTLASSNWVSSTIVTASLPSNFSATSTILVSNPAPGVTSSIGYANPALSCPAGFIAVPGVPGSQYVSTKDFCIMQYIAGNSAGVPSSSATLTPWVSISQPSAISACQSMGTDYHLITNKEWMTIARNAEQVGSNWTGGSPGSGIMAAGWRNGGNTAVAPANTTAYLYNTGANTGASGGSVDQRRTLTLSNGNQIWDLSGNVWEWTNDLDNDATNSGWAGGFASWSWQEWSSVGATQRNNAGPSNSGYNSGNGMGQVYGNNTTGGNAFLRGGPWGNGTDAGAFALHLGSAPSYTGTSVGFRCAR